MRKGLALVLVCLMAVLCFSCGQAAAKKSWRKIVASGVYTLQLDEGSCVTTYVADGARFAIQSDNKPDGAAQADEPLPFSAVRMVCDGHTFYMVDPARGEYLDLSVLGARRASVDAGDDSELRDIVTAMNISLLEQKEEPNVISVSRTADQSYFSLEGYRPLTRLEGIAAIDGEDFNDYFGDFAPVAPWVDDLFDGLDGLVDGLDSLVDGVSGLLGGLAGLFS